MLNGLGPRTRADGPSLVGLVGLTALPDRRLGRTGLSRLLGGRGHLLGCPGGHEHPRQAAIDDLGACQEVPHALGARAQSQAGG